MMEKVERLTKILFLLNKSSDPQSFIQSDKEFLANVGCTDIAVAQQAVLTSGVAARDLWQMWSRNTKLLPDQAAKLRAALPANHVLRRVLAEHELILCFIADLDQVNNEIQQLAFASSTNMEMRKLAQITSHLLTSQRHFEREEEIIFPELRRRAYSSLLRIIDKQHTETLNASHRLNELVWQMDKINFDNFKVELAALVNFLVPTMQMHIFIETNIVFPLAVEVVKDTAVWQRMKQVCDLIGYDDFDIP